MLPVECKSLPLDIVGLNVTPHVYSKEIRYWFLSDKRLGALVRIVVANRDPHQSLSLRFLFNGKRPEDLVRVGEWSWYEMPENKRRDKLPFVLGPQEIAMFTFNGCRPPWSEGDSFLLTVVDDNSKIREILEVPIVPSEVQITQASFLGDDASGPYAERVVVHVENNSVEALEIAGVQLYKPSETGLTPLSAATSFDVFGEDGVLPSRERGGAVAYFGAIPLVRGLLRVDLKDRSGQVRTSWAPRYFGKQQFDIGSGWLDVPTEKGVVALRLELFHKLLRRLHVNMARIESVPGYTDTLSDGGLYKRYPLRMMGFFEDVAKYSSDEWSMRIHGTDLVQEAQIDKSPMKVYEMLTPYDTARFPTTMTFSEDQGFRYYAGITDFPHFDAYRVNAGSADAWFRYKRWGWRRLIWGAPLEGIGEMTRTLNHLSRPAPIAAWSQHVHEGWYGHSWRKRVSPTPDEIRIQAYGALANGAKGLYWYSLQSWSLLVNRDTLDVTARVGREIRLLEDLYLSGDAYRHRRVGTRNRPSLDLSSLVTPTHAMLFAIDLEYQPNRKTQVFEYKGMRKVTLEFELPGYLRSPKDVFRVDADGIHDVQWKVTPTGVTIETDLDRVGVYIACQEGAYREVLKSKLEVIKAQEQRLGFDPVLSDSDFDALLGAFGYDRVEDIKVPED